jgi:hypothetical protein
MNQAARLYYLRYVLEISAFVMNGRKTQEF